MRKLLIGLLLLGGVHDAHDAVTAAPRGRRRRRAVRAPALRRLPRRRSARRTCRRWRASGATRTARPRQQADLARRAREARAPADVLLQPRQLQGPRATSPAPAASASMTRGADARELSRARPNFYLVSGSDRWYVRSGRHRAGARPLQQGSSDVGRARQSSVSSTSTPAVALGWRNAIRFPSAPRRGVSSIRRMPAARQRVERAVEIVDGEADVMDARAALGDELADGRVRDSRPRAARRAIRRPRGRRSGRRRRRRAGPRAGRGCRGRRAGSRRARARRCRCGRCGLRGGRTSVMSVRW